MHTVKLHFLKALCYSSESYTCETVDVRLMHLFRDHFSIAPEVPHISSQLTMHQKSLLRNRYKHLLTALWWPIYSFRSDSKYLLLVQLALNGEVIQHILRTAAATPTHKTRVVELRNDPSHPFIRQSAHYKH